MLEVGLAFGRLTPGVAILTSGCDGGLAGTALNKHILKDHDA